MQAFFSCFEFELFWGCISLAQIFILSINLEQICFPYIFEAAGFFNYLLDSKKTVIVLAKCYSFLIIQTCVRLLFDEMKLKRMR